MRIEIIHEDGKKEIQEIFEKNFTIGRSPKADIRIVGEGISRKHVRVEIDEGIPYLVDLGSLNGVHINGEKIPEGERREFVSFFPIIIGKNVIIARLPDEADEKDDSFGVSRNLPPPVPPATPNTDGDSTSDETSIIHLSPEEQREKIKKAANSRRKRKKSQGQITQKQSPLATFFVLIAIAGGLYYAISKGLISNELTSKIMGTAEVKQQQQQELPLLTIERCIEEPADSICKLFTDIPYFIGAIVANQNLYILYKHKEVKQRFRDKYIDRQKTVISPPLINLSIFVSKELFKIIRESSRVPLKIIAVGYIGKRKHTSLEIDTSKMLEKLSPETIEAVIYQTSIKNKQYEKKLVTKISTYKRY